VSAASVVDFPSEPFDVERAFQAILDRLHRIEVNQTVMVRACRHCRAAEAEQDAAKEAAQEADSIKA
jgi:hypothetical protein